VYAPFIALILRHPLFSIFETPKNIFTCIGFIGDAYYAGPGKTHSG